MIEHGKEGAIAEGSRCAQVVDPPSTPPRKTGNAEAAISIPSPKDVSTIFNIDADSRNGDSPSSQKNRIGMRRMLTKAQSLGENLGPTRDIKPISAPSTPSRTPNRTQSMPDSPSALTSPVSDTRRPLAADAIEGSGGKAKKTYGRTRSFLDVERTEGLQEVEDAEDRRTYAELRDRFEVNNLDDARVNLLPVSQSAA